MARILVVIGFLIFCYSDYSRAGECPVQFRMQSVLFETQPDPLKNRALFLVNTGDEEVTVLTRFRLVSMQTSTSNADQWGIISLSIFIQPQSADGITRIPKIMDYAPVTLRKNESVMIELQEIQRFAGIKRLSFQYSIQPEWATRFHLWSGSVESPVYILNDGFLTGEIDVEETARQTEFHKKLRENNEG